MNLQADNNAVQRPANDNNQQQALPGASPPAAVTVLMPAFQEAARIRASVLGARKIAGVTRLLVIDDGSRDDTAVLAAEAGAQVLRLPENQGKAAALRAGLDACPGSADDIMLLLDADLGESAAEGEQLLAPVLAGDADMTIAIFPKPPGKGGFGLVKSLARVGCWMLTRRMLRAPISGQRACRRSVLDIAPLGAGYGLEVTMNIAAADAGARIQEVPTTMTHHYSGRTLQGFAHRGRQFTQIFFALLAAAFGHTGERVAWRPSPASLACWLAFLFFTGWIVVGLPGIARDILPGWVQPLPVLDSATAWLALGSLLLGLPLAAIMSGLLRARRLNFRRRYIPALGGLVFLPALLYLLAAAWPVGAARWQLLLFVGWLLLGLYDDVAGNAQSKGFRGHLKALLRGQLSTGSVKMLGGGLLALAMAALHAAQHGGSWLTVLLSAAIIALFANAMNLFDLRPGRALKLFWVLFVPCYLANAALLAQWPALLEQGLPPLAPLLFFVTLLYAPLDFAAGIMLGDTGANLLGALLGFCVVMTFAPGGQLVVLLLLLALHLYAERFSITNAIEATSALRWLDQLGRRKVA